MSTRGEAYGPITRLLPCLPVVAVPAVHAGRKGPTLVIDHPRVKIRRTGLIEPTTDRGTGVVLDVSEQPRPDLTIEVAPSRAMRVRSGDSTALWAWVDDGHYGVFWRRGSWASPLGPIRADTSPARPAGLPDEWLARWCHTFTAWIEAAASPLWDGRWTLRPVWVPTVMPGEPPIGWNLGYIEDELLDRGPDGYVDWGAYGSGGILPLRDLSMRDAPRVKAYRKRAVEDRLAPVLLWWIEGLHCWLVLDGHDRLVAGLERPEALTFLGLEGSLTPQEVRERGLVEPEKLYERRWRSMTADQRTPHAMRAIGRSLANDLSLAERWGRTRSTLLAGGIDAWCADARAVAPEWLEELPGAPCSTQRR